MVQLSQVEPEDLRFFSCPQNLEAKDQSPIQWCLQTNSIGNSWDFVRNAESLPNSSQAYESAGEQNTQMIHKHHKIWKILFYRILYNLQTEMSLHNQSIPVWIQLD